MRMIRLLCLGLLCLPLWLKAQEKFSFIALGDHPYGPQASLAYRLLIDRINQESPVFSLHVGDIKSGSSLCSNEEFSAQLEHFQRFAGAVIYTPGDNEWTDCHRSSNGSYDPLERLSVLRKMFFPVGRSLGQKPIGTDSQSVLMPTFANFVENKRWHHQGVQFATVHIVGSNNNLEARSPAATAEFFERDEANVAWIRAAFDEARQRNARALVIAFQADPFELKSAFDDFPAWSGFKRTIEGTLLPLSAAWGRPVLIIHGDSHMFRIDQPFGWQKKPLRNVTRLIVPGASDVRAVRIEVTPLAQFGFQLVGPR
jgi:hypothetical protein